MIDFVPKKPIPFGSDSILPKKEKKYPLEFFHQHRWSLGKTNVDNYFYYEKIKQIEGLIRAKTDVDQEALNE